MKGLGSPAFVDPGLLTRGIIDSDRPHVIEQLVKAFMHYADKDLVMRPYNPGRHWILIVYSPTVDRVWYLDSSLPIDAKGNRMQRDYNEVIKIFNKYALAFSPIST